MLMTVLGVTGHRPASLPGRYSADTADALHYTALDVLELIQPDKVISGMALGWDIRFANAAVSVGIPLIAAVPFRGQESKWLQISQEEYHSLLDRAEEVVVVSDGSYSAKAMQVRNQWIVNNCDRILALWNGVEKGGTWNCVNYAIGQGKYVSNCWKLFQFHLTR